MIANSFKSGTNASKTNIPLGLRYLITLLIASIRENLQENALKP